MSLVERTILLLEASMNELKKNPFALDSVMNRIDNFWGIENGRLEKEKDEEE